MAGYAIPHVLKASEALEEDLPELCVGLLGTGHL
jgi:hypothetical protein